MKKQNTYKKLIGFLLFSFIMFSCSDLEPEIFDRLSPENYPQSDEDIEAALTGIYNFVAAGDQAGYWSASWCPPYTNGGHMSLNLLSSDEMTTAWTGDWAAMNEFLWNENSWFLEANYMTYAKAFTNATLLLGVLENVTLINETNKDQYIGELRALRAYFALQLYDLFGPVPLIVNPEVLQDIDAEPDMERPASTEMATFIETELVQATTELDPAYGSEWGRVTQGVAYTILMKLYLHEKNWQKVVETTTSITALDYELLDNYNDVFSINNESFVNTEVIWPIPRMSEPSNIGSTWFAGVLPQVPMYQSLTGITINIWGGLKVPWDFYDLYEEGIDERLERLIRYYVDTEGNNIDFREETHYKAVGACPKKFDEDPNHNGAIQGNDFIRYRYADVLLARAESLNELNGPNTESINLINEIRGRAGIADVQISDFADKSALRDSILNERGRELYCEGHRRQDLIRHGKYISRAQEQGYTAASDYHVLFPIPQTVIDENPNIIQNPGY